MIAILLAAATFASPFSDGCVLQRDRQVEIWGEAAPGEKVELQFGDVGAETRAGDDGRWRVSLPPMPASCRGRELKANSAVVRDVVVGEVWLASGQSNMAFAFN
jgi:sialate O-acetylesterase